MITTPASSITKAASKQTYYTVRFLVDRARVEDVYRAYGYFRWVDDVLDAVSGSGSERRAFTERQKSLLEKCYWGERFWKYLKSLACANKLFTNMEAVIASVEKILLQQNDLRSPSSSSRDCISI
jgi:phytoene/squalene synthetase